MSDTCMRQQTTTEYCVLSGQLTKMTAKALSFIEICHGRLLIALTSLVQRKVAHNSRSLAWLIPLKKKASQFVCACVESPGSDCIIRKDSFICCFEIC